MKHITHYSLASKFFHWLIAVIVISMLAFSFFLEDLSPGIKPTAILIHKSLGLTVLFLMIARAFWIIHVGKPALPASVAVWESHLARLVQYSLYFFLIVMPICGWVMSVAAGHVPSYFGLFNLPLPGITPNKALSGLMFETHETIAWIIIALLVLHVAGAVKHHFLDKDEVLKRMWFNSKK